MGVSRHAALRTLTLSSDSNIAQVITIDQVMVAQDPIAARVFKASKEEKLGTTSIFKGW